MTLEQEMSLGLISVEQTAKRLGPDAFAVYSFIQRERLPAQLSSSEASHLLGCAPRDVPVLVTRGLLKPLGNPTTNVVKYFARVTLEEWCNYTK